VDQKLERHLLENARIHGYSITRYASSDLKQLISSEDTSAQKRYLQRLIDDPFVMEAQLYDNKGTLLAKSTLIEQENNQPFNFDEQNVMTLLEDIILNEKRIGIIQLKIDRHRIEAPIQKLLNTLAIITVVIMILAIITAWLVSRRLTRSLRKLLKFPINTPEDNAIKNLDVSSELKLMLESSSSTMGSPAPVSRAEESGIHQLLAADSVAESADVIILRLHLCDLATWLKPDSGTPNVHLLRQLDRLLILTIHSQQGHLLSFDGITAQACFGLDGNLSSASYRAASCSLLLKTLLGELLLNPKICLRKEERLLIRHMKRTPVAIPIHALEEETDFFFSNDKLWLLLHKSITEDQRLQEQVKLTRFDQNWMTIEQTHPSAKAMIERQLTWIRYLLSNSGSS